MAERLDSLTEIEQNRLLHNRIADKYHRIHADIFNPHEQARIERMIAKVRSSIAAEAPLALDFGCGSGNMTRHLHNLGFRVVAADVTDRFIELLGERYKSDPNVTPYLLRGDAQDLKDYRFDVVCIYSVLHHLPDYLSTLQSLTSLIAPGGFLYIDHEASEAFWRDDAKYAELQRRTRAAKFRANWPKLFTPAFYLTRYRMWKNPRYQAEGDLHVWKDDHIEWDKVRAVAAAGGFAEVHSEDYLSYRPWYPAATFAEYAGLTSDMHCSLFQRRGQGM